MKYVEQFYCESSDLTVGDSVVIRTNRGTEMGTLVSPLAPCETKPSPDAPQVLRRANPKDLQVNKDLKKKTTGSEVAFCRQRVKELNLSMKVIDVEHLFGSGRIIFYFSADGRVDFRELVKDLASEYKTRIEMKQIGIRDEARILGEMGICGRELCCKSHIKEFDPVGMKMAKLQKDSLDPVKVSGRCGRLMCCLRFEYETYTILQKELPKRGKRITTNEGNGEVLSINLISGEMMVRLEDKRIITTFVKDLPKERREKSEKSGPSQKGRNPKGGSERTARQRDGEQKTPRPRNQKSRNRRRPHNPPKGKSSD
jgi:cell fate regulator YaaT (PSP1 superfamily)